MEHSLDFVMGMGNGVLKGKDRVGWSVVSMEWDGLMCIVLSSCCMYGRVEDSFVGN